MPDIEIVRTSVTLGHLRAVAEGLFGDLVKAVVDVERGLMAIGGDLHADEEALLIDDGSAQAISGASTSIPASIRLRPGSSSTR